MTDLYDATDYLRILSFTPGAGFDPITNPIFDIVVGTFPGLEYSLETNQNLSAPFNAIGAPITATELTTSFQVLLSPQGDFVKAVRH